VPLAQHSHWDAHLASSHAQQGTSAVLDRRSEQLQAAMGFRRLGLDECRHIYPSKKGLPQLRVALCATGLQTEVVMQLCSCMLE